MNDDDDPVEREERAVYAIIALAAAPVVLVVGIQGGVFDSGSTLCLLVVVIAMIGIVGLRRRRSLPRARIHRR